jgi:hypothetical protein
MEVVGKFVETFKEFSPRLFPPSFVPSTIMEETLEEMKRKRSPGGG